ncbi:MAG: AlpA family phage regulatory protein [Xanthomonadales bacterium]|nr:AlpA family phage regulatory protein [Xanthomonadales bacterium]MDL1868491.1 AlpA family phage regulatory protein [Gammaproteobacteria bacterium PRO6]
MALADRAISLIGATTVPLRWFHTVPPDDFEDQPVHDNAPTLLRLPDVVRRTGLSKTQIYRLTRDGQFPTGIRLSPRCTCWASSEVDAWIRNRIADARQQASA